MKITCIATCFGLVRLRTGLLWIACLNLAAGAVLLADGLMAFLPFLTLGDWLEDIMLSDGSPAIFFAITPAIYVVFALLLLYGVVKYQVKCLYAYALYGVSRVAVSVYTGFMLGVYYYDSIDFYIALSSKFIISFVLGLLYQLYLVVVVRSFIIETVLNKSNAKTHLISASGMNMMPLKPSCSSNPSAPPAYEVYT